MKIPGGALDSAIARAIFEVIHRLLINGAVVTQNPDGRHGSHVGRVPVQPVMRVAAPVEKRVVMPPEKVKVRRVKHAHHHVLVSLLLRFSPARIGA